MFFNIIFTLVLYLFNNIYKKTFYYFKVKVFFQAVQVCLYKLIFFKNFYNVFV